MEDVSEGKNFGTSIIPNLDSVAEFRLITNSFDAEYDRFSGAIINAITNQAPTVCTALFSSFCGTTIWTPAASLIQREAC